MRARTLTVGRRRGLFVALSSSLCIAPSSTLAAAAETPEAIHLRVEVEASLSNQCPGPERFMELLRAEHPGLTLAPEGAKARRFEVRIRRGRDGLAGEVVVTAVDGRAHTRTVAARDCPTLTRALAVVAAVASNFVTADPSGPDHGAGPPDGPVEGVSPRPPTEPAPAMAVPPSRKPSAAVRGQAAPAHAPAAWVGGVGLGTELVLGSLPRAAMGYRGYVDVQRTFGVSAIGTRLSLAYARAPLSGPSTLDVVVQKWTVRLEGCASRRTHVVISIEGCLGASSGLFDAFATGPSGGHRAYPWLSLGAGARARWHVGKSFYTELFGNVSAPLTTFKTVLSDTDTVVVVRSSVSPVVGEIGLGLGRSFAVP